VGEREDLMEGLGEREEEEMDEEERRKMRSGRTGLGVEIPMCPCGFSFWTRTMTRMLGWRTKSPQGQEGTDPEPVPPGTLTYAYSLPSKR
jgi:hypothetical protein